MRSHRTTALWLAAWAVWVAGALPARAVTLGAQLDRDIIRVGESAQLYLSFVGRWDGPREPGQIPQVPNLTISKIAEALEETIINGERSTTVRFIYQIVPSQPGDYTIGPITTIVNGQALPSPPMKLKVLPGNRPPPATPAPPPPSPLPGQPGSVVGAPRPVVPGQVPPPQPQAADDLVSRLAFTKLIVGKNEMFLGEVFPVTVELYFQSAQDIQLPNLRCDGFTVNKMVNSRSQAQVGNMIYQVFSFRTMAIPIKSGKLNFGPAECNLTIHVPTGAPNIFGTQHMLKQVSPVSNTEIINVLPFPPENRPLGFDGAVGNYSLAVTASPTNVAVGDPITLRVQIAGRGAIDNVLLPKLGQWPDFKTYPPNVRSESPDPLSTVGVKTFEQVVVPENAEIKALPEFSFSFFDPESRTYRTLKHGPLPILVRPGAAAPPQQPTLPTNGVAQAPAAQNDILHIKPHLGAITTAHAPWIFEPWFIALQSVPAVAWLVLVFRRKQNEWIERNPRLRRRRDAHQAIQNGLAELRRAAAHKDAAAFYAGVFRIVQERLGERLDLPASAITEEVIEDRLQPGGVPDETLVLLRELFEWCNKVRYASGEAPEDLSALVIKVEAVLHQLENLELAGKR